VQFGSRSVIDRAIAELAGRQSGYVLHKQLVALGLGRGAIARRLKRGLLIRVYHGVYAVGHIPAHPQLRARGALLACGRESALAYGSARSLWGIMPPWFEPFEVLVIGARRRPVGIRVHHSGVLLRRDIVVRDGLRVTSPALTVLHNAPRLTDKQMIRAVNELRMERRLTHEHLVDVVERFPRHAGARRVRAMFGVTVKEPDRSRFEDDWRPFARAYGLRGWDTNKHICGYRVDVLFEPDLLIVELDGWGTHGTKPAFESDREQDATILAQLGIPTYRVTRHQFKADPARHAERIQTILAGRDRS
jgi:very-short-patch-repair endonuclease